MYNFMRRNNGAVSIFLLIVMVPMLMLSSLFVDMSRLKLAEAVAESSGELTLNTALTNYDAVLKDMYGLFATSQDTDELFENLEDYYRQCIESAGVAEADADDYVAQIMQLIKSETGTDDLLNMNLTSFEVTKPTGGSLANPAVLKSQIVEFMKYRGPINLGMGIFDALNTLKNVKKQSELVDNKNNFYKQQTGMMEKLELVWSNLEDYQYRDAYTLYKGDKCTFPDGQLLQKASERLYECIPMLEKSIEYVVRYLYFAETNYSIQKSGLEGFGVEVDTAPADEDYTEIWTVTQTSGQEYKIEAEPDKVSVSTLKADLKSAYAAIQALEKQNDLVDQLIQGNSNMSATEKIKIVSKFNSSLGSGYHANIKNLVGTLVQLKNSLNGCKDDLTKYYVIINTDSSGNKTLSFAEDSSSGGKPLVGFINGQFAHLSTTSGHIKQYNALISRVHGFWKDTKNIVINARQYVLDSTKETEHRAFAFHTLLVGKIGKLTNALDVISEIKEELTDSESEYNKALAAWKSTANELSEETIGENDLDEIARLEKVLTVSKLSALETRLESAKSTLETLRDQVEQFKVLGKQWKDLKGKNKITYSTLTRLLSSSQKTSIDNVARSSNTGKESVGGETATYDKAYDVVINQLKGTINTVEIKTEWSSAESPNLTKDQRELYTWLYNNFCDMDAVKEKYDTKESLEEYYEDSSTDSDVSTEISDNKDNANDVQTEMEKEATSYNNKATPEGTDPKRTYDTQYLPSGEWKETALQVLEGNSETGSDSEALLSTSADSLSTLDDVMSLVGDMATTLRDDLYICNYIMNMFSYSTYEAEITVANGDDTTAFETWYEWNAADGKYQLRSDFGSSYTNGAQMLQDARTLTKVSINPNANYLYGKEVEYIIYGNAGVEKSYGTIYMLRFALNTVYAFTDAEIGNITTAAATALFGTPPLTPLVPVAKIAMTIGLALAESAYDLYKLKCGEEIPLMKNSNTWVMKPTNAAKAVVGEIVGDVAEKAIDEGAKLLNDALNMTDEELEKLINGTEGELNALADAAVENTMQELRNYGNLAVQELVNICNEINTAAMEQAEYVLGRTPEKVQQAVVQLKAWLATQGSDESDVVYLVKKTAVDYLENNTEVIGQLFDKLGVVDTQTVEEIQDLSLDIEEILEDIQGKIDKQITTLVKSGGNALHELRKNVISELKSAAANGAESLRTALRKQIGSVFGTNGGASTTGTNAVVSSLLYWAYSDYLQLFLLIATVASPESVLLRTADVIELNMQQIDGNPGFIEVSEEVEVSRLWGLINYTKTETRREANEEAFKLSESYTYLNIKATIEVKPMMMALPLMADTVESQLGETKWYQITYDGTMGY